MSRLSSPRTTRLAKPAAGLEGLAQARNEVYPAGAATPLRVAEPRAGEVSPLVPGAEAAQLLGGWRLLGWARPSRRADVHLALVQGLHTAALAHLIQGMHSLRLEELALALGVSDRTLRRHLEAAQGPLPLDLGSRVWGFALMLAKAAQALGDRADAERWLTTPAMGLDGERPLDMLRTEPGRALVDEFLERLLQGVYN